MLDLLTQAQRREKDQMPGGKSEKRGIWCLETVWFDSESNASIRPMLELVNALYGTPYVHRNAVSKDEFFYFLEAWANSGRHREKYPILILSYHGTQGTISLKDDPNIDWSNEDTWAASDSVVTLEEIRKRLAERCHNRIIHFSSCSSLDVRHDDIDDFLDETKASAISGYTKNVYWQQAFALDWLYLVEIQVASRGDLTPSLMSEVDDELDMALATIKTDYDDSEGYLPTTEMRRGLGFNMRFRAVPAS